MALFDSVGIARRLGTRLKMRHLMLLLEIEEVGSLTRAAERVASSQPAVTNALADLESMFGSPLFERTTRGMVPTSLGEAVLARARVITQNIEHLVCDMEVIASGHAPKVHIGVTPYVSGEMLSKAIRQTPSQAGRELAFSVHEGANDLLLKQLQDHALDVVIGRASPKLGTERLRFVVLRQQYPRLIASRRLASRLARTPLNWQKLAELDWVLSAPQTQMREQVSDIFLAAGLVPPVPIIESPSPKLIGELVVASERLVSIVPDDIAEELARISGVSIVPYSFDWTLPPIAIFTRAGEPERPANIIFAESVHNVCRATPT